MSGRYSSSSFRTRLPRILSTAPAGLSSFSIVINKRHRKIHFEARTPRFLLWDFFLSSLSCPLKKRKKGRFYGKQLKVSDIKQRYTSRQFDKSIVVKPITIIQRRKYNPTCNNLYEKVPSVTRIPTSQNFNISQNAPCEIIQFECNARQNTLEAITYGSPQWFVSKVYVVGFEFESYYRMKFENV